MQVIAHQGDTLDSLCYRHLGSSVPVEDALLLNPGLAAFGAILPHGTAVTLPDEAPAAATAGKQTIQLWD
jgi:phage tail protein X